MLDDLAGINSIKLDLGALREPSITAEGQWMQDRGVSQKGMSLLESREIEILFRLL